MQTTWQLDIKPSSRCYLSVNHNDTHSLNAAKWPRVHVMPVLGHNIADNGGCRSEWSKLKPKLWGVFWKNAGSRNARMIPSEQKLRLQSRTVLASFSWQIGRWPYQKTIAVEMDALQNRMVAIIQRLPRHSEDSIESWWRRRCRQARLTCARIGNWSILWAKRVLAWHKHVQREESRGTINSMLLEFHNDEWLWHRRAAFVPENGSQSTRLSVIAGRTGTRASSGPRQPRWEQGVSLAKQVLQTRETHARNTNPLSIANRFLRGC